MSTRFSRGFVMAAVSVLVVSAGMSPVGQSPATQPKPKIEYVDARYSEPGSGKQMYQDYCAACHGMLGKGDGPVAKYLSGSLPDLSMMTKAYGTFPADRVARALRLGSPNHEHGTPDMPLWGDLFRSQQPDVTELRIRNLRAYVESLQVK
jgi:mono/diheme cytochrome c family protein